MNYRIIYKDELYHHGVKGMKWGVRKQPVTSGGTRSRKGLSTAKKVAIGVAVAAAVGGISYYAIKTHRYNKAAHATVQRILNRKSTANWIRNTSNNMWGFDGTYKGNPYHLKPGRGSHGMYYNGHSTFNHFSENGKINSSIRLTGHSLRVTKYGAAGHRGRFYAERAAKYPLDNSSFNNPNHPKRVLGKRSVEAFNEQARLLDNWNQVPGQRQAPRIRQTRPVPRLKRQRGPRVMRVK